MASLRNSNALDALRNHSQIFNLKEFRLGELFTREKNRFQNYSLRHEGLLLDY